MVVDPIWVALSLSSDIGGATLRNLLLHFNHDLEAIVTARTETLLQVPGVGRKIAAQIRRVDLDAVQKAIQKWEKAGIAIVSRRDPSYPRNLLEIADEPPTLFARGCWQHDLWNRTIAIVGTRAPSREGFGAAIFLAGYYAKRGYTIVSGLAKGIDTSAHRGALSVGGRTVAVLGSGVLNVYPPQNMELAEAILAHGALVSEVQPNAPVSNSGLVARNRIISGLCESLLVIETGDDGGAMYAARQAMRQKRVIYVLDMNVSGNQTLIHEGAIAIRIEDLKIS